jgi:hypothetical protein
MGFWVVLGQKRQDDNIMQLVVAECVLSVLSLAVSVSASDFHGSIQPQPPVLFGAD